MKKLENLDENKLFCVQPFLPPPTPSQEDLIDATNIKTHTKRNNNVFAYENHYN